MKTVKKIFVSVSFAAMITPGLYAQGEQQSFDDLDQNKNGKIEQSEFDKAVSSAGYQMWDANTDGQISKDEFYKAGFALCDENQDKKVSGSEWQSYLSYYSPSESRSGMEKETMKSGQKSTSSEHQGTSSTKQSESQYGTPSGSQSSGTSTSREGVGSQGTSSQEIGSQSGSQSGAGTSGTPSSQGIGQQGTSSSQQSASKSGSDKDLAYSDFMQKADALGIFDAWDVNGDSRLDRGEFAAVSFNIWDRDNNGSLEKGEYNEYTKRTNEMSGTEAKGSI